MKVGVVGRTGSGKSTLGLTLSRIIELERGQILIDGVDISQINLQDLRCKVTVIPQDPTIFSNTLRFNIDPLGLNSTEAISALIKRAGLQDILERRDDSGNIGLDMKIEEGGGNLSVGEKQLVCICRAVLRKNKVVLLDEATANIDIVTEEKILKLISEEFVDATMLTIAHRLNTIIESDMIAYLEKGRLLEYDTPKELMKRKDSHFSNLL